MKRVVGIVLFLMLCVSSAIADDTAIRIDAKHIRIEAVKFCFEGTIWVRMDSGHGTWGGQQLAANGKPIRCDPIDIPKK